MNQFLGSLALIPFEKIVNAVISRDPYIAGEFSKFDDKCVEVVCTMPPFNLSLRFEDGEIKLSAIDCETLGIEADATLTGTLETLLGLLLNSSDTRALANAELEVSGDAALVNDLYQTVESLDIDWQDYLTPLFGDVLSHEIGEINSQIISWGQSAGDSMRRNIRDYLNEEARLAPSALEVESFSNTLDQLRLSVDRASARTELLGRRIELLATSK